MEPPSGPARRRCAPSNRLLLAASLLTFWPLPTTAQLTIEVVPPLAAEGSNVLLLAHNVTENPLGYTWYTGDRVENQQLIASYRPDTNVTTKGPAHSGRETLYPNGTLLIQHVTQKDTGSYTLLILKNDLQNERQPGYLHVHPVLPTPVITSNNSKPWEHEDTVVLTCGPETQNTSYIWWINDQSLPNSTRLELSEDKRTLTVFNVTRKDTGPYVCEARNPVSVRRSDPFTLQVLYPVARPSLQASNTTVAEHEGPVVLTCLTNETGVSIRWFFEGQSLLLTRGMTLSLDNSTLTIDPVSRKDNGDYQCEVSNRGNSSKSDPLRLHVKYKPTSESSSDLSTGAVVGIVIGAVAGVAALIAALVYFLYIRETRRATDQRDLTEHKSSDHNHSPHTLPSHGRAPRDMAPPRPHKPGSREMAELPGALSSSYLLPPPASVMDADISYGQGHSDSSPEKVNEVEYSSVNFNAQELKKKATSASPSPTHTETIYSEVKKQ